ncbi:MAG: hypothetical protein COX81_00010 [Candidatus Magasanikbacteria bacterium CG_4_10_14_0_2_um_filter_37_12]|uniref:Thioredoxin domain-containing protein n=1 Tax=Candidatus Magasanikbacteria bacterium CG_4_10_14_0_2_um_filter_37_12 TaxID=1974637 RepID=A0A2M7VAM2_9BACT|nr:MAG: hypothetical protein COX81_00010 [Candidatus Magasanikbacteria bacterium CG_4_10_14_0_2_um_filter_37_12]
MSEHISEEHSGNSNTPQQPPKQSPLAGMSQSQTFIFGIIAGIMVLCTIGFFILLNMTMSSDDGSDATGNNDSVSAGQVTPTNVAPTAPEKITISPIDEKIEYIRGNKKAKITLVEFSDLDCPFCGRFHPTVQQIVDTYPDDVRWVYRHFPLTSLHPNAQKKANAVECAAEQGKFWEMTDIFFDNQGGPATDEALATIAKQAGVGNIAKFTTCVNDQKYATKIAANATDAQNAGGQGTPYSIILGPNGETIPINGAQPFEAVQAAVESLL